MDIEAFHPGDRVARRSHVDDEGIILVACINKPGHYYVIFAQLRKYVAKPVIELMHSTDIYLLEKRVHKKKPPPKFKKI